MKKSISFIKLIKITGIIIILSLPLFITGVDVFYTYKDFKIQSNKMRSNYIEKQKQIVKSEVLRVVDMINYERSLTDEKIKGIIRNMVNSAYSVSESIYKQNKDSKSKNEIEKIVVNALRTIRFANGTGYFFMTRLDGTEMLFADHPEMEGKNLLNIQDLQGKYVIKDMIKIVMRNGEGFYQYYWTKPKSKNRKNMVSKED
jgi:signal transduction histidine kinase